MAAGLSIAEDVRTAFPALARAAVLTSAMLASLAAFSASSAWGDDCFTEIGNAIVNTGSALDSPQCQSAFAESSVVTIGLTTAFSADQGLANQVCNALSDVNSWLPAIPQEIQAELGALDPVDFATCACSMYQGVGQLPNDIVSCIQDFICGVSQLVGLGDPCQTCSQPPPVQANCTPPDCTNWRNEASPPAACENLLEINPQGPSDGYFPLQKQQTSDGSWVAITGISGSGALQTCNPGQYCICPSPMTLVPVNEWDPSGNTNWYYETCQCPSGTKPLKPTGPLAYVCICDQTGQPAVPPDWGQPVYPGGNNLNPTHSYCPNGLTNPCPVAGQIRVSNDKCVPPCTKAGEVMTPDGTCCDPNHVATCGQCCGPGYVPDPVTGTCTQQQVAQ
jgi:hypothetical protein